MGLRFDALEPGLEQGVSILLPLLNPKTGNDDIAVAVTRTSEDRLAVALHRDGRAEICFREDVQFFRGLGLLAEHISRAQYGETLEVCAFDTKGVMFDVSQSNAVILPATMERILQRMALMGLNMLMIYMEDSYVLEGHPYFGYMRPQYTQEDLRAIDDYAAIFGIEVIPCVQSLAHLIDVIKWPAYRRFCDTADILLVGDERTYAFVEDCIVQIMKPFRTRRIHIGMDEAWKIGRGNYQDLHGPADKHELMKQHLDRVYQITEKLGLEPMIWSDMFFSTSDERGNLITYSAATALSEEIKRSMPENLGLVFWEYDHTDEAYYDAIIQRHQEFGNRLYFAGGIYNCFGFGVNYSLALQTIRVSLDACKRHGVKDAFLTVWGDDGTENNILSVLLGLQYFAESCYGPLPDVERMRHRFSVCCDAVHDDFLLMNDLDEVPGLSAPSRSNPSKWLLWQHPMYGLFDENVKGWNLGSHYHRLTQPFGEARERNPAYADVFATAEALCQVLSIKAELGNDMRQAYITGDRSRLHQIAHETIPELIERYRTLRAHHSQAWFAMNKPEGFDIIDLRYGTQFMWLDTARNRLTAYLEGQTDRLIELEKPRIKFPTDHELPFIRRYEQMVSASRISHLDCFLH